MAAMIAGTRGISIMELVIIKGRAGAMRFLDKNHGSKPMVLLGDIVRLRELVRRR